MVNKIQMKVNGKHRLILEKLKKPMELRIIEEVSNESANEQMNKLKADIDNGISN